ncbi:MAG: hypothetical protein IKE76_11525 [Clostridia bacterium]|nr:hypothetical protein [Clostridia bacterium]
MATMVALDAPADAADADEAAGEAVPAEPAEVADDEAQAVPEAEAPEEPAAVGPADWQLTFDETLFNVDFDGADYFVTPTASFETATILVEAGDSYTLNLYGFTLPVLYPAQSFEEHTETMTVRVAADEGAFPEGTTMSVADVEDESTLDDIASAVEADNTAVKRVHAVDITFFNAAGEEIEPLIPISVSITVNEAETAQRDDAVVVHVDDAGNAEKLEDADVSPDEAAFDAEAFSVYAVVVTEHYISADGQRFAIQLTYGPDAGIPEDAVLKVTEVTDDEAYLDLTTEAIGEDRGIRLACYFDISIMSGDQEIQPAAPVEVKVTLDDEVEADHVQAVHFGEGEPTLIEAEAQDAAVTFEAEGFSVYGIVYTVDFAYEINGKVYAFSIPGGEAIPLTELVDLLHILEDARAGEFEDAAAFVARVTNVEFTDPTLVEVVHEDGVWALQSLQPFTSEEALTVTMDDGERFVVQVTDAQIRTSVITASGETYIVTATYDSETGIPEDAALAVTEILQDENAYDRSYDEYVASAEDALGREEGSAECIRLFDIKIVDPEDATVVYQPAEGTAVDVQIELADVQEKRLDVVHFEEGREEGDVLEAETVEAAAEGQAVRFEADGFSIYAVAGFTLESTIVAGDGNTYKITLTFTKDALLPDGARLEAVELDGEAYEDYVGRTAAAMDAAAFDYARAFDISIVDEAGVKYQPAVPVEVSIELMDAEETGEDYSVVHFAGEAEDAEQMTASTLENTVSFSADGFSVYAITKGPQAIPDNWQRLSSVEALTTPGGVYIGQVSGYYFTDETTYTSKDKRTGITKTTPANGVPSGGAAKYWFEKVEGTVDQFYVYCKDSQTGDRKYVYNGGNKSLSFAATREEATPFTVTVDDQQQFRLKNGEWYWNMQGGAQGARFCAYNDPTDNPANNDMAIWRYCSDEDPYGIDGSKVGLMSWNDNAMGKAMMASVKDDGLEARPLTVMVSQDDRSDRLFVPRDIDDQITMWQFHWAGDDRYYLSGDVKGVEKYLVITSSGLSLADSMNDATPVQVIPGTGIHEGQVCLKAGGNTLTYSGGDNIRFTVNGTVGNEWLYLAETSTLTSDYFLKYSAKMVGVSDSEVVRGSQIVVYTRAWNDERKRYDYYLINGDGNLVRCYESGDSIEWVGHEINTMLWQFTEYTEADGITPNGYYELFNPSSECYLAPQITGDQILSENPIGIILDGRINKKYYTPILAWDKPAYSYVGLKVEDGRIVTCPRAEAMDFYFAVMDDMDVDDTLHTVSTLDNNDHGITMKLIDIGTREEMSAIIGSNEFTGKNAVSRNTVKELLSTDLKGDGYPMTKAGKSLGNLYAGDKTVNHLFIESTYEGTGYYEFDSTQNFATLDGGDFVVYRELGSSDTDNKNTLKHGQFFPFNDLKPGLFTSVNRYNVYDPYENEDLPDSDPRKYEQLYLIQNPDAYFAMEMDANFTQTPNGLDAWGHDIIFEFAGDDDFWLYVDGELVIDLGGVHSAVPGKVNFRTGEVDVNGAKTTLYDLFYNNYKGRDNHTDEEARAYVDGLFTLTDEDHRVFSADSTHNMRIFYMERGASASNLHIRFNLASTKTGTVQLTKALEGVDTSESTFAEFPYQILYKTKGDDAEHYMTNAAPGHPTENRDHVFYKDSLMPVKYISEGFEIDGQVYDHVFFLKPDETAEINFPSDATEYRIVECGVDTGIYDRVTVNGNQISGVTPENGSASRKDFGIDWATIDGRPKVKYVNRVNARQTLTIVKKLCDAEGTPIDLYDDQGEPINPNSADLDRLFSFRLYLGSEYFPNQWIPARMYRYHVKNPKGEYCMRDMETQKFVPITDNGQTFTNYEEMNNDQKDKAFFETSLFGGISEIPAYYTVEVRELMAGTRFKVVERPTETPDGYRFRRYALNGIDQTITDPWDGVRGKIEAGKPSNVEVWNDKGYGLCLYKAWSDADFVTDRDPAFFAVFVMDDKNELDLVNGTVRALDYKADPETQTLYWYFPSLQTEEGFDRYEVYEVTLTGNYTVDGDGNVTGYTDINPVPNGNGLKLNIVRKGSDKWTEIDYRVTYEDPEPVGDNVRIFRAANTSTARPRIVLRKQDWKGDWLPGAVFTLSLEGDEANAITYTSDANGLITIAYPESGKTYVLTEVKSPAGYRGLSEPLKFSVQVTTDAAGKVVSEDVTVSPDTGDIKLYYKVDTEGDEEKIPRLIVRDRPWTFEVVKVDATTGDPLEDAVFSLHRQVVVGGQTSYVLMKEYGALTTDENGILPKLNNTLLAGTYKLKEESAPAGYITRSEDIHFTVSNLGGITLIGQPEDVQLTATNDAQDKKLQYRLEIPNKPLFQVSIWKTDLDYNSLKGASFELYKLDDYDDENEAPREEAKPIVKGSVGENGILQLGRLAIGHYRLVEVQAPSGYEQLKHAIRIEVSSDKVTAIQDSASEVTCKGDEHWVEGQDSDTWQIRVWNNPGVKLPSTGGPGSEICWLSGMLLMLFSALLLARRKEQRFKGQGIKQG